MKHKISVIITLLILFLNNNLYGFNSKIIVKVEDEIITNYDLKNKILITLILSNQEINQQNIDELKKAVLDQLINLKLKKISEKPTLKFLASTGCYIFNKKILKYIEKDKFLDFNELVSFLLRKKINIYTHSINDNKWSDFGTLSSFKL